MIVVEEKLTLIFEQLPTIDGFKPIYKWGNEFHLKQQLELYSKAKTSPYPLIYQTSNLSKQKIFEDTCEATLKLVLACQNTDVSLTNEERWAMSYRNILYPLVRNIETCFNLAGAILWDGDYTMQEFPNYGNGKDNFTLDVWDAIVIDVKIGITNECIRQIEF